MNDEQKIARIDVDGWVFKHASFYFDNVRFKNFQTYCQYWKYCILSYIFSFFLIVSIPFALLFTYVGAISLSMGITGHEYMLQSEILNPIHAFVNNHPVIFFIPVILGIVGAFIIGIGFCFACLVPMLLFLKYLGDKNKMKIQKPQWYQNLSLWYQGKKKKWCPMVEFYSSKTEKAKNK